MAKVCGKREGRAELNRENASQLQSASPGLDPGIATAPQPAEKAGSCRDPLPKESKIEGSKRSSAEQRKPPRLRPSSPELVSETIVYSQQETYSVTGNPKSPAISISSEISHVL